MKITEVLNKYPHLRAAAEGDNEEILHFFKSASMNNEKFIIRYDRSPDYFLHLKEQSEKFYVLLMLNQDMSIGGTATFLLRSHFHNGERVKMAYLADLRTSPTLYKRTRVEWRQFYQDLVKNFQQAEEFDGCKYLYTAILKDNHDAIRALTKKNSDLIYDEITNYKAVSLMARIPFIPEYKKIITANKYSIRKAVSANRERIFEFLREENLNKSFGYFFSKSEGDEFSRREQSWQDFDIESFLIVENNNGEMVGVVYPRTFSKSKKLVCEKMSWRLKLLCKFLSLFKHCKLDIGSEIKLLYLTHLEIKLSLDDASREAIFKMMIDYLYDRKITKDYHAILFINFSRRSLVKSLNRRRYVYKNTDVVLYQVMSREDYENHVNLMDLSKTGILGFEIGIA